jgi:hypothetical protein
VKRANLGSLTIEDESDQLTGGAVAAQQLFPEVKW